MAGALLPWTRTAPVEPRMCTCRRAPRRLRLCSRAQAAAVPAVRGGADLLHGSTLCGRAPGRDLAVPAAEQVAEAPGRTASTEKARVAVLGASGYTREEVVRLLALHPVFDVTVLTGETQAGKVCSIGCRSLSHQSVVCAGERSAGLPRTACAVQCNECTSLLRMASPTSRLCVTTGIWHSSEPAGGALGYCSYLTTCCC